MLNYEKITSFNSSHVVESFLINFFFLSIKQHANSLSIILKCCNSLFWLFFFSSKSYKVFWRLLIFFLQIRKRFCVWKDWKRQKKISDVFSWGNRKNAFNLSWWKIFFIFLFFCYCCRKLIQYIWWQQILWNKISFLFFYKSPAIPEMNFLLKIQISKNDFALFMT